MKKKKLASRGNETGKKKHETLFLIEEAKTRIIKKSIKSGGIKFPKFFRTGT